MNKIELDMMKSMVSILNDAAEAYYNTGNPIMSDELFDARLEDLRQFEQETGFILANSPTHNVGAKVLTELNEVTHSHPMLSLEKCHTVEELIKFANKKELVASIKLDGLTVSLTYEDGVLVKAETRGNGYVGSDITEHIRQFKNVPFKINKEGTYIVDGEAVITDEDFAEINKDGEFKNSRNLAAGTLSVLDTSLVAKRRLRFFVWDIIKGGKNSLKDNLEEAKGLGFDVVPHWVVNKTIMASNPKNLQSNIDYVFEYAKDEGYPCDGVVFKFNDIAYGKSLGATEHHFRNGLAYKRKDDTYRTELIGIDWTCGKTGTLTPTAIFEPVEISGTTVERASVHNVSILTKLDLHIGDIIEVAKCNEIIPQVKRNISADERMALGKEPDYIVIPSVCPVCGGVAEIKQDNDSKVLVCTNDDCKGKLLGKLTHFVSKNAINIDGMSEATIEFLINKGWVKSFKDLYNLNYSPWIDVWKRTSGYGDKSVENILSAIETSKNTTLDRFIYSLSIPLIGRRASKDIAKYCHYDAQTFINFMNVYYDFTNIDGFGAEMQKSLNAWWANNDDVFIDLFKNFTFEKPQTTSNPSSLEGLTFVITGSLNQFANRDEAKEKIESLNGKVSGSVSAKTSYLVNNDIDSTSGKNKKAKELGIPIINEDELIKMLN